jgi:NitT/TauT family transport system substrate-binding protein
MRRLLAISFLAFAIACSRETQTATPQALTRVTFNLNPSLTYAPLMIAKEEGFFAQEGIDARIVSLDSNSALAALLAGDLDVLSTGVRAGVFNMIRRGQPLQVVAAKGRSTSTCEAEAFIAPVAMAKRIAAAGGNLRGERVALIRGGVAEYLTEQLLANRNVTLADVVAIPLPQGTAASSRDKIEAVRYVSEPNLSILLREGAVSIVDTPEAVAPGHQSTFIVYGKRLLRDDPTLGRRVMRAYLHGVRQYNEGKTKRNVEIVSRFTKLPADIVTQSCWATMAPDGRLDPASVQPFLEWATRKRYLDGPVDAAAWWNPRFLND